MTCRAGGTLGVKGRGLATDEVLKFEFPVWTGAGVAGGVGRSPWPLEAVDGTVVDVVCLEPPDWAVTITGGTASSPSVAVE
jgi:hypothetical protein